MAKRSLNQRFVFQIAMIISVVMTVIAVISVQLLGAVTTESLEHRVGAGGKPGRGSGRAALGP